MRDRVIRLHDPPGIVGSLIEQEPVPEPEDRAVRGGRDLHVVKLLPRMGGALEVLATGFDPFHRPAQPGGGGRNQDILGVHRAFGAKPSADIGGDDPHPMGRQAKAVHERALHEVRHLRRRPDGHASVPEIGDRQDPPRLDGHARGPRNPEPLPQPDRRRGERAVGVSDAECKVDGDIIVPPLVDPGTGRIESPAPRR